MTEDNCGDCGRMLDLEIIDYESCLIGEKCNSTVCADALKRDNLHLDGVKHAKSITMML